MAKGICAWCGGQGRLLVHHVSWIHQDNTPSNRVSICYQCHNREHAQRIVPGVRPRSEYVAEPSPYAPLPIGVLQDQYDKAFPRR